MTSRPIVGTLALVLSILWLTWVVIYLPAQSRPAQMTCAQLSSEVQVATEQFVSACRRLVQDEPDRGTANALIVSSLALVLLSIAVFMRERNLLRRTIQAQG